MCKIDLKEREKGFKRARRYQEQERNKRQEAWEIEVRYLW